VSLLILKNARRRVIERSGSERYWTLIDAEVKMLTPTEYLMC